MGFKNVSIVVAAQGAFLNESLQVLEALCSRNNFGRTGELVR